MEKLNNKFAHNFIAANVTGNGAVKARTEKIEMNIHENATDFFYAYQLVNLDTKKFYEFHGDVRAYGAASAIGAVNAEQKHMLKLLTKQTKNRILDLPVILSSGVTYDVQLSGKPV